MNFITAQSSIVCLSNLHYSFWPLGPLVVELYPSFCLAMGLPRLFQKNKNLHYSILRKDETVEPRWFCQEARHAHVISDYITWSNGDSGMKPNFGECISCHVQRLVQVLQRLPSKLCIILGPRRWVQVGHHNKNHNSIRRF